MAGFVLTFARSLTEIAEIFGVSRPTVYRTLDRLGADGEGTASAVSRSRV